jgi:hypothetical protein
MQTVITQQHPAFCGLAAAQCIESEFAIGCYMKDGRFGVYIGRPLHRFAHGAWTCPGKAGERNRKGKVNVNMSGQGKVNVNMSGQS